MRYGWYLGTGSSRFRFDLDIFGKRFESIPIGLHHRNGHVTGLTGIDVAHDSGLTRMRAADDIAVGAVG